MSRVLFVAVVIVVVGALRSGVTFAEDPTHVVQVVDGASGEPIAGATIVAESFRFIALQPRVVGRYETDSSGRATVRGTPTWLKVHAPGYFAEVLHGLGVERAWVVHGRSGLDEVDPSEI